MIRMALAATAVLALAACSRADVDPADPWAALSPWDHGRPGVEKLEKGTEYFVVRKGDGKGASPQPRDRVEVNYEGRLAKNGLIFDSSYQRGETATFPVNGVIPGWTAGLQKMQPGDDFMFWIPAAQGYGERGAGVQIPPNADLMFQVELVKVMPDPWPKALPWPTDASDIIRQPSGLEYRVIDSGPADAGSPSDNDIVLVHFEGRLEDPDYQVGDTFEEKLDSSLVVSTFQEGEPKEFMVSGLTPGWRETVKLMRPGDRWMVRIPAQINYGEDSADRIPPNSTVIYEIELLAFGPPNPGAMPPPQ
ncbi:MAG: FKBP-type peptidyl-prolyl cis-trans isomerase [Hyphomonadaceae bacterium]